MATNLFYNSPSNWTMFGKRISQERAQIMLPLLIERARERRTISFGELADHFDVAWAMPIRPAVVCTTGTLYLLERNQLLGHHWEHGKIPRIANMVTRAKGQPSRWVAEQLEGQKPPIKYEQLLEAIFDYDKWRDVLNALGLPR